MRRFFSGITLDPGARGRFAPSPTGRMHLGNVCAALLSWLSVKMKGGKWILRIEDIDPQRSRREYALQIEDDLRWLGLNWDEGGYDAEGPSGPYRQSLRTDLYSETLGRLWQTGLVYDCRCTRAELHASSAPHQSDGRVIYGGRCRPEGLDRIWREGVRDSHRAMPDLKGAARIFAPDVNVEFNDLICGRQRFNLSRDCGDFILRRRDGAWAYQLAVVADDLAMGITEVVRGEDLLLSAAQQIYLMNLLGGKIPEYAHFPLLRNSRGERLSKRDGAMSMEELRKRHTPGSLIGEVAFQTGLIPSPEHITPGELLASLQR